MPCSDVAMGDALGVCPGSMINSLFRGFDWCEELGARAAASLKSLQGQGNERRKLQKPGARGCPENPQHQIAVMGLQSLREPWPSSTPEFCLPCISCRADVLQRLRETLFINNAGIRALKIPRQGKVPHVHPGLSGHFQAPQADPCEPAMG